MSYRLANDRIVVDNGGRYDTGGPPARYAPYSVSAKGSRYDLSGLGSVIAPLGVPQGLTSPLRAALVQKNAAAVNAAVKTIQSGGGALEPYVVNGVDYGLVRTVNIPGVATIRECPTGGCVKQDFATGFKAKAPAFAATVAAAALIPGAGGLIAKAGQAAAAVSAGSSVFQPTPILTTSAPANPLPSPAQVAPAPGSSAQNPVVAKPSVPGWMFPVLIGLFLFRR